MENTPSVRISRTPLADGGGHWLTVTLARPARANALNLPLLRELRDALCALEGVRAVFLGTEGSVFSAGLDLEWLSALRTGPRRDREIAGDALADLLDTVARVDVPVVAFAGGGAFGAGIALLGAADWVVAAPESKFRMSEARLGISGGILLKTLRPRVAESWLRRWVLSAEDFDGRAAFAAGLVTDLMAPTDVPAFRRALESRFAQAAPAILRQFKRALREPVSATTDGRLLADALESAEGGEGLQAFREKRAPRWQPL